MRLQLKNNSLKQQTVAAKEQIEQTEASRDLKKELLDKGFDIDYVIELAREKLHMCLPNEIIFYNDN